MLPNWLPGWLRAVLFLLGCALLAFGLGGCGAEAGNGARADGAYDAATAAAIAAAQARARAAEGRGTEAEAREAEARALALHNAAVAEDERQAKLRAEERAAVVAEDKARLGWWATAAGIALLVLSAGASVLGWYFGLGKLTQGIGAAGAASGAVALALGLSWGWLPILAAVVIVGGALVLLLRKAGAAISTHAERMQTVPPEDAFRVRDAKVESARDQLEAGVWTAVQRLRGKAADRGKLQRLLGGAVR